MATTTQLSPAVEKGLEGQKSFDVSLDKENDFVFVPIDTKLLRTIQAYVRKMNRYHDAETRLIRQIHEDLLSILESNYDFWFGRLRDDAFERDVWYPDLGIFNRLPPVKLNKGPCVNPRITATRLKYIRERHERCCESSTRESCWVK